MKDIIFITNYFFICGAATVMKMILQHLSKTKTEIKLVSFLHDDNIYPIPENIEYIKLNDKMNLNFIDKIKSMFRLRKIIKKTPNSVIVSFEYFINMRVIISSFLLKNKVIVSERNDPSKSGNKKKKIRNFLYMFADTLVCQTNDAKNYFPIKIQKKTVVIPNLVRDDLPKPYFGKRKKKIVTFCRIEKQKNLFMMVDAFKIFLSKYSDYTLEIYGDGTEKQKIIDYVKENGIEDKVIFKPFIQNLHNQILDYTMFISTSDFEGISNSMLESLTIGLPTICTDCPCGGAKMAIINNENGLLSSVGDVNEFAEKMIYLVENPELMKKFTDNYKITKTRFESTKILSEWESVIYNK